MIRTTSPSLGILIASAASLAHAVPTSQEPADFRVQVHTDVFARIPDAEVRIQSAHGNHTLRTDDSGRTSSVQLVAPDIALVSIDEATTPLGSLVGQSYTTAVTATDSDRQSLWSMRYVPEARTLQFQADPTHPQPTLTRDPYTESWYSTPGSPGAFYDFELGVATLEYNETIEAYFAFHGAVPPERYEQGLLLRSPDALPWDRQSLVLAISTEKHDYGLPRLSVAHFGSGPTGTPTARLVGWVEGFAFVHVEVDFHPGDTLFLLSDAESSTPMSSPPSFLPWGGVPSYGFKKAVAAIGGAHSSRDDSGEKKPMVPCEPQKPDASHCSVPSSTEADVPPKSKLDCKPEKLVGNPFNLRQHEIEPSWPSDTGPPCNPKGSSGTTSVCWEYSGEVRGSLKVKLVEIGASLRVGKRYCESQSFGECVCIGTWTCSWVHRQVWSVCKYVVVLDTDTWWPFDFKRIYFPPSMVHTSASGNFPISQVTTCIPEAEGCQ